MKKATLFVSVMLLVAIVTAGCSLFPFKKVEQGDGVAIVTGTVVDEHGIPVLGAEVRLGDRTVIADDAGFFRFENVSYGRHDIEVAIDGKSYDQSVEVNGPTVDVLIEVESAVDFVIRNLLSGKSVLQLNGKPATGEEGDRVEIPDSDALDLRGPMTIEVLVRVENHGNYGTIISKGSQAYELGADWRSNRELSLQWRSARVASDSKVFPGFFDGFDSKWVHIAVVNDGTNVYAFRNGVPHGESFKLSETPNVNTAPLILGNRIEHDLYMQGAYGYVRIWNVVRTQEEIARNLPRLDPEGEGLVANYRFDEGQGNVLHDSAGEHHGTIYGATWTTAF